MDRYSATKIKTDDRTTKSYMETTIYPKILPSNNDLYIVTDEGDRLDLLANQYYNDSKMWWVIAIANNLNDASYYIEPGTQLRIPANSSKIYNDLVDINQ